MSYADRETGEHSGEPIELYHFSAAGENWYLTGSEESFTHDTHEYVPTALLRTAIAETQERGGNSMEVDIPADHAIAQRFLRFMPDEPMSLVIRRIHRGLDPGEAIVYWTGRVTAADRGDFCSITCEPETALLKKKVPGIKYQRICNRVLYDTGCQVVRDDFRVTATITAIDGLTMTAPEFADKPDQWFRNGYIEAGSTQRRMIVDHVGDTVTLLGPMYDVNVSDAVYAFAGCDRKYSGDCLAKFDNQVNFLGFPWIPTRNPFEGIE